MIGKEFKNLSRRELVEIIYQLKKSEQQMQEQMTLLQNELEDKRIKISSTGSISEAAVRITNIFSTAQMTADLYLHEISCIKSETIKECEKMKEDAKQQVDEILTNGKKQYDNLAAHYENDYKKWQQLKVEIQKLEEASKDY